MAAACIIFLWLCRRGLHVRLARQTSRQQQCKAALARLRYKQDCCSRAALVEEQCRLSAAAQEKTLADKADERHRQDALAKEQCCHEANKQRLQDALANKRRRHEAAACNAALVELAHSKEQRCRESAEHDAAMAENALAAEQRHQELAECAAVTAENALTAEQRHQESAECAAATAEKALADEVDEQGCQEEAAHTAAWQLWRLPRSGVAMRWRQLPQWWLRRRSHSLLRHWREWRRPRSKVAMRQPCRRKR